STYINFILFLSQYSFLILSLFCILLKDSVLEKPDLVSKCCRPIISTRILCSSIKKSKGSSKIFLQSSNLFCFSYLILLTLNIDSNNFSVNFVESLHDEQL